MRQRPWALVVLAFLHLIAPIGNILFNALITQKDVGEYFKMALSMEYFSHNWIIIVCPLIAGIAIYAMKKWSFYVYLLSITALFLFSYLGYQSKADSVSLIPVLVIYLINISVVSFVLLPAVRNIYFDRRMRWWELDSRYKCDFTCSWEGQDNQAHQGHISNISVNGLFIKSPEPPADESIIDITIPFDQGVTLNFNGKAIIHNRMDAIGFGVQFKHTSESKKNAKELVADLETKGMRLSTLQSRPEDSFTYWLRTLITTGKGILPKSDNK